MAKKIVRNAACFALMNVLIKGTPSAIKNALSKIDDDYRLRDSTYKPDEVKHEDTNIVEARIIFEEWDERYFTPDEIPFGSITDIKFIGLGNGRYDFGTDGSYVFFKDFGETSVSECYKFSDVSPNQEEFEAQYDVLKSVVYSFMDHPWLYQYENYSCGEYCPWAFDSKKDEELITKWKNDDKYKS